MQSKRLYRSEEDRVLGGVCGGLGAYLGVDPTVVRVAFVVLAFLSVGIVLYLVMWVIVPSESALDKPPPEAAREGVTDIRERARQGAQEARQAFDRLRGRERGGAGQPGGLVPEPRPAGEAPPRRPAAGMPEPRPAPKARAPAGERPGEPAAGRPGAAGTGDEAQPGDEPPPG